MLHRLFHRTLFHFEAPEDGGGALAAAADAAPESTAPETTPAAEVAGWSGPSEDEWYQTQAVLAQIAQGQQQGYYQPEPQGLTFEQQLSQLDPLDPSYSGHLMGLLAQRDEALLSRFGEMMAPLQQHSQAQILHEGEERAWDILDDIATREGDFNKEDAYLRAETLFPEFAARYGNSPRAAEQAIMQAVSEQRAREKEIGERYVNEYKASLEKRAGAPSEPGLTATSAAPVAADAETEADVVKRIFAARQTV